MLPEKLSNNLCSLVPHLDRLTLTAILDFDRAGILLDKALHQIHNPQPPALHLYNSQERS